MDIQGVGDMGAAIQATQKQAFGASVVSKTLDYMNQSNGQNAANADYDFQTKVLSAGGLGQNINRMV